MVVRPFKIEAHHRFISRQGTMPEGDWEIGQRRVLIGVHHLNAAGGVDPPAKIVPFDVAR